MNYNLKLRKYGNYILHIPSPCFLTRDHTRHRSSATTPATGEEMDNNKKGFLMINSHVRPTFRFKMREILFQQPNWDEVRALGSWVNYSVEKYLTLLSSCGVEIWCCSLASSLLKNCPARQPV